MSEFEAEPGDVSLDAFESADADIDFDALLANQEFASTVAEEAAAQPFDPFDPNSVAAYQDARDRQLLDQISQQLAPVTDAMTQRLAAQNLAASQAMQAQRQQVEEAGYKEIGKVLGDVSEKLGGTFDAASVVQKAEAEFDALAPSDQTRENAEAIIRRQAQQAYRTNELEPVVEKLVNAETVGTGLDAREVRVLAEQTVPSILKAGITGEKAVRLAIEIAQKTLKGPEAAPSADLRRPSISGKWIARAEARDELERLNRHIENPQPVATVDHADLRRPSLAAKYAGRY